MEITYLLLEAKPLTLYLTSQAKASGHAVICYAYPSMRRNKVSGTPEMLKHFSVYHGTDELLGQTLLNSNI